jgi:hypothetical protein
LPTGLASPSVSCSRRRGSLAILRSELVRGPSRDEHRPLGPTLVNPCGPTRSANHHVALFDNAERGGGPAPGRALAQTISPDHRCSRLILRGQPAIRRPTGLAPSDTKCVFSRAQSMLSPRFSTVFQKESKPDI